MTTCQTRTVARLKEMLGQRLAQLRKRNGWSQAQLASAIGGRYDRSMISHVESGRATLHFDGLVKAARTLHVSLDYLAGLTEDSSPSEDRVSSNHSGLRRVPLRQLMRAEASPNDVLSAPVIGYLAFRDEWLDTHGITAEGYNAIEVPDESMEPTLQSGAWILIDHQRTRRQGGDIFAVLVGDEVCVRRAVYSDDGWMLACDNPKRRTLAWPSNARILGQVVWSSRVL